MADTPTPTTAQPAADPSQYIRTYAKDVMALTGKAPQDLKPRTLAPAKPARPWLEDSKQKHTTVEDGVEVEEQDAIGVEKKEATRTDADLAREAVLDRLRARQNAEDLPPLDSDESALQKLAPVAPIAPQPKPTPPPRPQKPPKPPKPEKRKRDIGPSPLHTFKTDFADRVDTKKASVFSVLAAEGDARQKPAKRSAPAFPVLPLILGVLFVALGGTGVYLAYRFATEGPSAPIIPTVPSLIFADERTELSGSGDALMRALAEAGSSLSQGSVLVAYTTEVIETEDGTIRNPRSGGALINAMELPAPEILLRNTAPESTVGAVRADGEARPFFILRVTSYERTFAGMLEWEKTIATDLALFYPPRPLAALADVSSTTSATSTPTRPAGFRDEILANHDARVLYDSRGESILLYGYADKETLIIARDRAAFSELLRRLATSKNR